MKPCSKSSSLSQTKELATKYSAGKLSTKTYVEFKLIWQGNDLVVVISGGESHIGSLAYSYSNGKENKKFHQYTHITHREDEIVRRCMDRLMDLTPGEIIVIGGIHYDGINKKQIDDISNNCFRLIERIAFDLAHL